MTVTFCAAKYLYATTINMKKTTTEIITAI